MGLYHEDRLWSDKFIPAIRAIVGPLLLEPSPLELDAREATDLIVFRARDMRIAARVRRAGYADHYRFDFTIRSHRDSGAETELAKIISGWGDWFFYGHDDGCGTICLWWLIDLNSFRLAHSRHLMGLCALRYSKRANGDGTYFIAFDLLSFPAHPPLLVASSEPLP